VSNLILLIVIPFISALAALGVDMTRLSAKSKKLFALILSLLPLALIAQGYSSWIGQAVNYPWITTLGINFHVSMDGISFLFVLLTAIIIPVSLYAIAYETSSATLFYCLVLLLQGILFILFTTKDLALFTIAWESMLLPIYFIMTLWGGPQRQSAALQFLIYMIAGSALFVAAVLGLYFSSAESTFDLNALATSAAHAPYAHILFAIFLLAFAVKTPLFPFHGWLPDTYSQAPFAGTILLAALLSKAGIYGIIRIGLGLFPAFMEHYSIPLLILAIVGTLYSALAAWSQLDYKRLIAYSSLSHVNFILAGLFVVSQIGLQGAVLQAFNHGITITALFLVAYWLQKRVRTTTIGALGGINKYLPRLCWFTLFFVVASIALPGTNNFVGELIIFFALFEKNMWLAAILALSIILSAIYMLRWMQTVYFQEPKGIGLKALDLVKKEMFIALSLAAIILAVGIYPKPLLEIIKPSIINLDTSEKGA
jgi:NADH-quinone oxidoreductase subunit M